MDSEDDSDLLSINLTDEDIEYDDLLTYCRLLKEDINEFMITFIDLKAKIK